MSRFLAQNTLNSGQNRDILAKCPELGTLSRNSGRLKGLFESLEIDIKKKLEKGWFWPFIGIFFTVP